MLAVLLLTGRSCWPHSQCSPAEVTAARGGCPAPGCAPCPGALGALQPGARALRSLSCPRAGPALPSATPNPVQHQLHNSNPFPSLPSLLVDHEQQLTWAATSRTPSACGRMWSPWHSCRLPSCSSPPCPLLRSSRGCLPLIPGSVYPFPHFTLIYLSSRHTQEGLCAAWGSGALPAVFVGAVFGWQPCPQGGTGLVAASQQPSAPLAPWLLFLLALRIGCGCTGCWAGWGTRLWPAVAFPACQSHPGPAVALPREPGHLIWIVDSVLLKINK